MKEKLAQKLVDDYVKGWESNNEARILSSLSEECVIIESHGPTYRGLGQVKKWIDEWFQSGKVDKWNIDTFFFATDSAFFEWSFTCTIDGKTDSIDGASVVLFKSGKIDHIHEYRMTKSVFDYYEA